MPEKIVIVADPGIDGAFAIALALLDPGIDVLAIAASAGNVDAGQATRNVHTIVERIDPPRLPRVGEALPVEYEMDGTNLHGPGGLGGVTFPTASLHHPHPGDKVLVDMARLYPEEVTLVLMGPATVFARAVDRDPGLTTLLKRIVFLGGNWHDPGNAGPAAEFHFFLDPLAAQKVIRSRVPVTLIPLDAMRKVVLSPTDLLNLPNAESRASRFLAKIIPFGIGATARLYGIEGFHLKDVLGVIALALPGALSTRPMVVDVETQGELTRGMSVFDTRWVCREKPNVDLAVGVDVAAVRDYIRRTLAQSADESEA